MLVIVIIMFLYIMYQNKEIIELIKVNTYGYDPTRRDP